MKTNYLISIFYLFILFYVKISFAQLEASYWYFGDSAGLYFDCSGPHALTNSAMYSFEGSASISDKYGNLLFYTNGGALSTAIVTTGAIWNKDHNIMYNGILGDSAGCNSAAQSSIIIPNPANKDQYYLFTSDCFENGYNKGLSYTLIDMTLDAGKGGVTQKGVKIASLNYETVGAVLHDNMRDYWVISHKQDSFVVVLVDSLSGVQNPITIPSGIGGFGGGGELKSSPDRSKIFFSGRLYDFDASTGAFNNLINIGTGSSCSFSPNSEVLYTSSTFGGIAQYDLTAGSIPASQYAVAGTGGALELAPDGKIYIAPIGTDSLHVINYPDSLGLTCSFEKNKIFLEGRNASIGLPNFLQHYFVNTIPKDTNLVFNIANDTAICLGDTVFLALTDTLKDSITIIWTPSFGLIDQDTVVNPQAAPSSTTTYHAQVISQKTGCEINKFITVTVKINDALQNGFSYHHTCIGDTVIFTDTSHTNFNTWKWNFGDPVSNNDSATGDSVNHYYNSVGKYPVQLIAYSTEFYCLRDTITTDIIINPLPIIDIIQDTTVCEGYILNIGSDSIPGYTYVWTPNTWLNNTSISNPIASPTAGATTYTISVTDTNNCFQQGQFTLTCLPIPIVDIKVNEENSKQYLLKGTIVQITADTLNTDSFNWQPTSIFTNNDLIQEFILQDDSIIIHFIGYKGMCIDIDSITLYGLDEAIIAFPSIFSPNADGNNDIFSMFTVGIEEDILLEVFNRFGEKIYFNHSASPTWDGIVENTPQEIGTYIVRASTTALGKEISKQGILLLIK